VVAERGGRGRSETLEAPFVGRDDDLCLLKELFHATSREKRTRLVSVIGAAGIGKTRLTWEFLKYVDGLVETVWFHDGARVASARRNGRPRRTRRPNPRAGRPTITTIPRNRSPRANVWA
jgi:hypothetical protein